MLKLEFKEPAAVLLILAAITLAVSIIGTNPIDHAASLGPWERAGLGGLGVALVLWFLVSSRRQAASGDSAPLNQEFKERLRNAQENLAEIIPESKLLGGANVGRTKFDVVNDSICSSRAEVIVSSDDNHFGARGGVAKAILEKAGQVVREELGRYRSKSFSQGQLVVTTGGKWPCRAILHLAVIDLDENRYPDTAVIKKLVHRSLQCALALGARSIALPVLGGGTASKYLKPQDSARAIAEEVVAFLEVRQHDDDLFTHVALYVFDKRDADGLPARLMEDDGGAGELP